jgi:hypothetical protein
MLTTNFDPQALAFDQYQRYTVVREVADLVRMHLTRPCLRVLDVGGFFLTRKGEAIRPLAHFLPHDWVVAVDLVAETLPDYLLSSGLSLPFPDRTFDLVVSCDTLEHVPCTDRPTFVDELLRVAGCGVVLIAPFDHEFTCLAERILHEYLVAQGLHHAQLQEHLDNGLPDANALRADLTERKLPFVEFPDGYLQRWLMMMLLKYTPGLSLDFQLDLDRFYNRCVSPHDRREPAYRRVFVITLPSAEVLLPAISKAFELSEPASDAFSDDSAAELIRLVQWGQVSALTQTLRQAQEQWANAQAKLTLLEAENTHLRHMVAAYERGRFMRLMRWLHNQRDRLPRRRRQRE